MSRTLALMIRCSSLASVLFRPHALLAAAPAPGAGGRGEVRTHCRRSDLWVAEDLLGGAVDRRRLSESAREGMPEHVVMQRSADDRSQCVTDEAKIVLIEQRLPPHSAGGSR